MHALKLVIYRLGCSIIDCDSLKLFRKKENNKRNLNWGTNLDGEGDEEKQGQGKK